MESSLEKRQLYPRVADFYVGKSILITGANGFLGIVLLEALLRSCPGIKSIYIVLREKKGKSAVQRKNEMFQKTIFDKIKVQNPDVLEKVHLVPGEVSMPDLGISPENLQIIYDEVSIVFHCAASISFLRPLRFLLSSNVGSTNYVIELCRKLKNMEVLVYTSTQYSNSNTKGIIIKEKVQRLPFKSQDFLDALKEEDDAELNLLHSQCLPAWLNHYTFSKCLSENVIEDNAPDLKCAIIRPALISSVWKEPLPGYSEENSSLAQLSLGCGKGFIKVILGEPDVTMDLVPVDVVANAHIVAAWRLATERSPSPLIVNCTSYGSFRASLLDFKKVLFRLGREHTLPKAFASMSEVHLTNNLFLYRLLTLYEHYIPAFVLDMILRLNNQKPRLVSLYKFYDNASLTTRPFLSSNWDYEIKNFKSLGELPPEDVKLFYTNLSDYNVQIMADDLPTGLQAYDWSCDKKSKKQRQRIIRQRYYMMKVIQYALLMFTFWILYTILSL